MTRTLLYVLTSTLFFKQPFICSKQIIARSKRFANIKCSSQQRSKHKVCLLHRCIKILWKKKS